jgi:hypothetical protein
VVRYYLLEAISQRLVAILYFLALHPLVVVALVTVAYLHIVAAQGEVAVVARRITYTKVVAYPQVELAHQVKAMQVEQVILAVITGLHQQAVAVLVQWE